MGWHGFCAALTAASAKTMPKGLCGMNVKAMRENVAIVKLRA
jgi:hypothetical protein